MLLDSEAGAELTDEELTAEREKLIKKLKEGDCD